MSTIEARQHTQPIEIGTVVMGGGAPIVVQSMLTAPPLDPSANLAQIDKLAQQGCEIVRMAIPQRAYLDSFEEVCRRSPVPVVADVHFDPCIAIEAARRGAAKLRINPGNIGGFEATAEVLKAARKANIAVRIGVNAGSLDDALSSRSDLDLAEKLALSAQQYVDFCESCQFKKLVVSAKAHDVMTTVKTYRILSKEIPHVPLHIGITEAGSCLQGSIKSAAGLGILLSEGIGDTLRISLTDEPETEVKAAWILLSSLDLRRRGVEIISCPTCGRCQVELIELVKKVERELAGVTKPFKVAVMGCVVNGPGEARSADIGVACGDGSGVLFKQGEILCKVSEEKIVDTLLEEIKKL